MKSKHDILAPAHVQHAARDSSQKWRPVADVVVYPGGCFGDFLGPRPSAVSALGHISYIIAHSKTRKKVQFSFLKLETKGQKRLFETSST